MANNEQTTSEKLSAALVKYRAFLIGLAVVVFVFVAVIVLGTTISNKSLAKDLSALDAVEYAFKKDADSVKDEEWEARRNAALAGLVTLTTKSGIVGVRANMLKADILFQQKEWESSRAAWVEAAETKKSIYTAPICYYNAAVCSENLNDLDSAVKYYEKSIEAEDFFLVDHAYFSLGRVNEAKGDTEAALKAYEKLNDLHPTSKWASVAKSRSIAISAAAPKAE